MDENPARSQKERTKIRIRVRVSSADTVRVRRHKVRNLAKQLGKVLLAIAGFAVFCFVLLKLIDAMNRPTKRRADALPAPVQPQRFAVDLLDRSRYSPAHDHELPS